MTTLLTGASGFLGAHTVAALLERGEDVRAFVRTPSRLDAALAPLGLSRDDPRISVAQGDMTDARAIREAVAGCDAVVHNAATYSFKRSDRPRMMRDNPAGTEAVLGAGRDAGCRVLVHVSSTVALATPGGGTLSHESPLGPGHGPYSDSKVASEKVARWMQKAGDPVTIVNPGGVLGPHDPYLGETNEAILHTLQGRQPAFPRGRQHYVDVRDTAAVLAAAVQHEPGGRYVVPGHAVRLPHEPLRAVTGRRLPVRVIPPVLARLAATPGYLTGASFLPGQVEGVRITACGNDADTSRTTADLGVEARPLEQAYADTVRWLVEAGHLDPRLAGRAAP